MDFMLLERLEKDVFCVFAVVVCAFAKNFRKAAIFKYRRLVGLLCVFFKAHAVKFFCNDWQALLQQFGAIGLSVFVFCHCVL